ncbi:MAG TPA: DUF2802 domain-containing protein [Povalibacter sp.]|nr:DUF2802 domain-containing protein [Povalibacter sp.]
MFEILPNPSLETLLLAGRAMLLVGAFWVFSLAFIRWRRANERDNAQLQAQLERAFVEMRSLHESVMVMSARLEAMCERSEMESRLAPAGSPSAHRGYDMAARLAKNGAGVEELIANCGISRHEAELLARLHSARETVASAASRATQRGQQEAMRHESRPGLGVEQQGAHAQPPQGAAGRKRGSLLSVVG